MKCIKHRWVIWYDKVTGIKTVYCAVCGTPGKLPESSQE